MARTTRPANLAHIRDLRMSIWLTPFITDADTRALLLALTDRIAVDLPTTPADGQEAA